MFFEFDLHHNFLSSSSVDDRTHT